MSRLSISCFCVAALLSLSFFIADAERGVAAKAPVLVANTAWQAIGKVKFSLKGAGKLKDEGEIEISFDDTGFDLEGESPTLDQEVDVDGSYVQDAKGKLALTVDQADLVADLSAFLVELFANSGITAVIDSLTIEKVKIKAKAKTTKTGDVLKLKFSTKFAVTATAFGETESTKGKVSFSGTLNRI